MASPGVQVGAAAVSVSGLIGVGWYTFKGDGLDKALVIEEEPKEESSTTLYYVVGAVIVAVSFLVYFMVLRQQECREKTQALAAAEKQSLPRLLQAHETAGFEGRSLKVANAEREAADATEALRVAQERAKIAEDGRIQAERYASEKEKQANAAEAVKEEAVTARAAADEVAADAVKRAEAADERAVAAEAAAKIAEAKAEAADLAMRKALERADEAEAAAEKETHKEIQEDAAGQLKLAKAEDAAGQLKLAKAVETNEKRWMQNSKDLNSHDTERAAEAPASGMLKAARKSLKKSVSFAEGTCFYEKPGAEALSDANKKLSSPDLTEHNMEQERSRASFMQELEKFSWRVRDGSLAAEIKAAQEEEIKVAKTRAVQQLTQFITNSSACTKMVEPEPTTARKSEPAEEVQVQEKSEEKEEIDPPKMKKELKKKKERQRRAIEKSTNTVDKSRAGPKPKKLAEVVQNDHQDDGLYLTDPSFGESDFVTFSAASDSE